MMVWLDARAMLIVVWGIALALWQTVGMSWWK